SENFMLATSQIAQTTLRSVLGQHTLDELLSEREKINSILQGIIDESTAPWGIKVSIVEVKDVEIPTGMQRAMARQAEAERERRAKIINSEGEFQAAERLKDAALVIAEEPMALQLRYLQTLLELGSSQATTIAFPSALLRPAGAAPGACAWCPTSSRRSSGRRSSCTAGGTCARSPSSTVTSRSSSPRHGSVAPPRTRATCTRW